MWGPRGPSGETRALWPSWGPPRYTAACSRSLMGATTTAEERGPQPIGARQPLIQGGVWNPSVGMTSTRVHIVFF